MARSAEHEREPSAERPAETLRARRPRQRTRPVRRRSTAASILASSVLAASGDGAAPMPAGTGTEPTVVGVASTTGAAEVGGSTGATASGTGSGPGWDPLPEVATGRRSGRTRRCRDHRVDHESGSAPRLPTPSGGARRPRSGRWSRATPRSSRSPRSSVGRSLLEEDLVRGPVVVADLADRQPVDVGHTGVGVEQPSHPLIGRFPGSRRRSLPG